jgi:Trk K+ transport system NAD-binding subunit
MLGMTALEGRDRTFLQALQWAAETLSTTGYGGDHTWSHPWMVTFVILLQFMGVFLIFLIFPIYLIPFLEERFEARLPKAAPSVPEGTVLLYQSGPAVASLLSELQRSKVPTLLIEDEADEARRMMDAGHRVVVGRLDDGVLARVRLGRARALVANGTDDENAAVILSARQMGFAGEVLAVVEDPSHRKPMMLAGADAVYTPRHILGAALAARASERLNPRVLGAQALGKKLVVSEVRLGLNSELAGKTLAAAQVGRRTGVTVIGQWVEGSLITQPTADMELVAGGLLVVAGGAENVKRFSEECRSRALRKSGPFVVAGYGEVGQKVVQLLTDAGEETLVIDRGEVDGVDILGNVMDPAVLEEARVDKAQAVILAVDSDSATLFATVILKDYAADVPVIARVNQVQNVERIHRAGADFALSISQVAGQILAGRLLKQEAISINPQLKVLKVSASGLEGRHPAEAAIRERTGSSVVAVERGDELLAELDTDFRFESGDEIYICGSVDATQRFLEVFPQENAA